MSWVPVSKGDRLPTRAILAGATPDDGVLYIGLDSTGEIGKYNVNTGAPGGNIHNLWTRGGGCHFSGKILTCGPGQVATWAPYEKGHPLPEDAFLAGQCIPDGVLYVGRVGENGEVGKINVDSGVPGGNMFNLWCHSSWFEHTSGQILCIRQTRVLPRLTGRLVPIIQIHGGGNPDAYYNQEHTIEVGSSDENFDSSKMQDISSKASVSIDATEFSGSAEFDSTVKSAFQSTLTKTSKMERVTKKFHIRMDRPTFVYVASISVDGGPTLKSDSVVQSSTPLVRCAFAF